MAEYIEREATIERLAKLMQLQASTARAIIEAIPAADVLPRDEAIKMGAELAAMHGSDATSQQLEEAYLKGVEDGMTRRDVRPVVLCRDCKYNTREVIDLWGQEAYQCITLSIISFFATSGIVWVVAWAFDFAWSWKLSIAVWLILWVLTSLFKNK